MGHSQRRGLPRDVVSAHACDNLAGPARLSILLPGVPSVKLFLRLPASSRTFSPNISRVRPRPCASTSMAKSTRSCSSCSARTVAVLRCRSFCVSVRIRAARVAGSAVDGCATRAPDVPRGRRRSMRTNAVPAAAARALYAKTRSELLLVSVAARDRVRRATGFGARDGLSSCRGGGSTATASVPYARNQRRTVDSGSPISLAAARKDRPAARYSSARTICVAFHSRTALWYFSARPTRIVRFAAAAQPALQQVRRALVRHSPGTRPDGAHVACVPAAPFPATSPSRRTAIAGVSAGV